MDQYRVTQILQELINDKNSELSQLNNFLSEAQTSSWSYVNPQDYQNVVNDRDMAWTQFNNLQSQTISNLLHIIFLFLQHKTHDF